MVESLGRLEEMGNSGGWTYNSIEQKQNRWQKGSKQLAGYRRVLYVAIGFSTTENSSTYAQLFNPP